MSDIWFCIEHSDMYTSGNKAIYMDKCINLNHGELTQSYLSRMIDVINKGVNEHPRTFAIRIDLRLPGLGYHAPLEEHDIPTSFAKTDASVIRHSAANLGINYLIESTE